MDSLWFAPLDLLDLAFVVGMALWIAAGAVWWAWSSAPVKVKALPSAPLALLLRALAMRATRRKGRQAQSHEGHAQTHKEET
jgi:membrane protein implicated in regulation of membrane protease activity